jgi:RimJ/RimL family protein N-acetyltransferase
VHRLEARAAASNGRGNGALAKLGAIREGLLRRSLLKDGRYHDQVLWAIVREDWMQQKAVWSASVH